MNTASNRNFYSLNWSTFAILTLAFWISGITILDLVIIPSLSSAGMMIQGGFASAGYLMFGIFNHIELICAGIILTAILSYQYLQQKFNLALIVVAATLLAITLIDTYSLTPQMSGLGISLDLFEGTTEIMSPMMVYLHESYWSLEIVKILSAGFLLFNCYKK